MRFTPHGASLSSSAPPTSSSHSTNSVVLRWFSAGKQAGTPLRQASTTSCGPETRNIGAATAGTVIRPRNNSGSATARIQSHGAGDDFFHDLAAARINAGDACIRVKPGDGVFIHVAGAAVQLQALVGDPALDLAGEQFRLCRNVRRQLALVVIHHAAIDESLRDVDPGAHLGQLEPRVLESRDRAAERMAFLDVLEREPQ